MTSVGFATAAAAIRRHDDKNFKNKKNKKDDETGQVLAVFERLRTVPCVGMVRYHDRQKLNQQ